MSTPQVPAPPPTAVAEEVLLRACLLVRRWSAGGTPEDDCTAAIRWLEDERAAVAPGLEERLVSGCQVYRRDLWLQYVTDPATRWAWWTGGELERPVYEVLQPPGADANKLRLRRPAALGPVEVLDFLTALAAAEERGKLDGKAAALRGVATDLLWEAVRGAAGDAVARGGLLEPLRRLRQRHRGDQLRAAVVPRLAVLDQPPPDGLRDCLRQLLTAAGEVEGCLTRACEVRLFRQLPEVVAPFVPQTIFESARAAVDGLREEVTGSQTLTLRQVCAQLDGLGEFARLTQPILAGPAAGAHRQWARRLLENFARLGQVARCALGDPPPVARPPTTANEPAAEPPPASEGAAPAPVSPPQPPEDAALAALAATSPAAEAFLALALLTEELLRALRGSWSEAEDAVKGLHYPGTRFRQKAARAARLPADERDRQLREAARQLADEFVNKIRRLDALLPGIGNAALPPKGPAHVSAQHREQLRAVRGRVFQIMRDHGGYEEYPVAVGDSVRKHGPVLDDVVYVANSRLRPDEIVHILEPGYVRRREDGRAELIRSPKVVVAR